MDASLIAAAFLIAVAWAVYGAASRYRRERARRTVYVAPVFRLTVTPERARELAQQRTRIAEDAESAALSRGEQSSRLYSSRVRTLARLLDELPPGGGQGDLYDRD